MSRQKTSPTVPPLRAKAVNDALSDKAMRSLHGFLGDKIKELKKLQAPKIAGIDQFGPDDEQFWGQPDQATSPSFGAFVGEIREVFQKSVSKGYGPMQPDEHNPLYSFMLTFFSNDHALGEIIYKSIRYRNKRNPEDLIKIAAWAWLVWMHHWREEFARGN